MKRFQGPNPDLRVPDVMTLMGDIPLSWWLNKPTQSVKALLPPTKSQLAEEGIVSKMRLKTTHVVGRIFVGINAMPTHTYRVEKMKIAK